MSDTQSDPSANSIDSSSSSTPTTVIIDGQEYSAKCIAYLQSILSADELPAAIVHCSTSNENTALDSWGLQGGQFWLDTPPPTTAAPTASSAPTLSPSRGPSDAPSLTPSLSFAPSSLGEPTYHPTLHGRLFVLRGTIYYDRNANGQRDANVATEEFGPDTEYNVGLGGVNLRLVECDLATGEAVAEMVNPNPGTSGGDNNSKSDNSAGDGGSGESHWNSYSSTISQGYDVLFHPVLADRGVDGGKYNMINIKINRAYYIEAEAPAGFLFTGGVCNDAVPGWRCPKPASYSAVGEIASMKTLSQDHESYGDKFINNGGEDALGLRVGRSMRCVSVDRTGKVSGNLDLGVMRSGDVKLDKTEVRMTLDLGDVEKSVAEIVDSSAEEEHEKGSEGRRSRSLFLRAVQSVFSPKQQQQSSSSASLQDRILHHATHLGNGRYLLQESDQYAIGVVAAEVLASSLDDPLAARNVELDHISPREVILSISSLNASNNQETVEESDSEEAAASVDSSSSSSSASSASNGSASTGTASYSAAHDKSEGLRRSLAEGSSNTRPTNTQPTYNSRNPAPRRQNRLTIDLEVWGHYPPQLNVDFDNIVQESINAQTDAIRAELVDYNTNCEDQTEKVSDHGFVLDDFEEIHSNKGVVTNTRTKRERNAAQQAAAGDDAMAASEETVSGGVFRTACSKEIKLPEYFEESLKTVKATKVEAVTIFEEQSAAPVAMIGVLAALMVVVLIGAFFVFRMGFKKKSTDQDDEIDDYSHDEEDTEYSGRKYKDTPAPIPARPANFVGRELDNIGTAVSQVGGGNSSRFKFGGRKLDKSQTSEDKREAYTRKGSMPVKKVALDESESIVDPTKALDDDQIAADDRIKDFERRLKTMKASAIIEKKKLEDFDQSTVSTRPEVPGNIKFAAAQLASKNSGSTGKGSSDDESSSSSGSSESSSSSSSDSSAPANKRKKKVANKKNVSKGKMSRRVA
ncbi:hypothetical protein ACHAWO_003684 [Cyclotella atomus]|uniref:Uncharacterized protein n=1 Tax=Cyclotella atomus TaxID=382360 RepID=A0ABD3NDC1_9STRA